MLQFTLLPQGSMSRSLDGKNTNFTDGQRERERKRVISLKGILIVRGIVFLYGGVGAAWENTERGVGVQNITYEGETDEDGNTEGQ